MSAPDEAVRIAWDAVPADIGGHESYDVARDAVAALNAAGWLHAPAEVAALRALVSAARALTVDKDDDDALLDLGGALAALGELDES